MNDLIDEIEPKEVADYTDFATTGPAQTKQYEKITEDLKASHAYGEIAAKENAKEALEEL